MDLYISLIVPCTRLCFTGIFFIHLLRKKLDKLSFTTASKKLKRQRLHLIKELRDLCNGNFNMKNKKLKETLEDEKSFHAHGLTEIVWKKWMHCQK